MDFDRDLAVLEPMEFRIPDTKTVGETAGIIWNYLYANGSASLIKLKSDAGLSAGKLHLGLGWLLKEDKVEFLTRNSQVWVKLK